MSTPLLEMEVSASSTSPRPAPSARSTGHLLDHRTRGIRLGRRVRLRKSTCRWSSRTRSSRGACRAARKRQPPSGVRSAHSNGSSTRHENRVRSSSLPRAFRRRTLRRRCARGSAPDGDIIRTREDSDLSVHASVRAARKPPAGDAPEGLPGATRPEVIAVFTFVVARGGSRSSRRVWSATARIDPW